MSDKKLELRKEIHKMKAELHSSKWKYGDDSLYTRAFINNINCKRDQLVALMGDKG
jgi:hypothetical protein|tara:strand:+ start:390 stop:557 length:168 start_codon:yes stop_codon:yes gene_type:complete